MLENKEAPVSEEDKQLTVAKIEQLKVELKIKEEQLREDETAPNTATDTA